MYAYVCWVGVGGSWDITVEVERERGKGIFFLLEIMLRLSGNHYVKKKITKTYTLAVGYSGIFYIYVKCTGAVLKYCSFFICE